MIEETKEEAPVVELNQADLLAILMKKKAEAAKGAKGKKPGPPSKG